MPARSMPNGFNYSLSNTKVGVGALNFENIQKTIKTIGKTTILSILFQKA